MRKQNYWRQSSRKVRGYEQSYSGVDGIKGLIPKIRSKPLFLLLILIGIAIIGIIAWGIIMAVIHTAAGKTGITEQDLDIKSYMREFENAMRFFKF